MNKSGTIKKENHFIKNQNHEKCKNNNDTKNSNDQRRSKKIAIISYITLIGLIIAFVMNNDKKLKFASYHIRQSLGLCVVALALGVIGLNYFNLQIT